MPLIGKERDSDRRVDIRDLSDPRATYERGEIVCPLCDEPFYIADGLIRSAYFSHYAGECKSQYHRKPESPEHRFFKAYISNSLAEHISEYSTASAQVEYPVKEILRVIDVAFVFRGGWIVAHEIQLSSITIEEIQERTDDYRKVGIDVHWWLGGSGASEAVKEWCQKEYGGCFVVDKTRASEHIALHEALRKANG